MARQGPRKRQRSSSPVSPPELKQKATVKREKPTLFDAIDEPTKPKVSREEAQKFFETQRDDDASSSLGDVDSDEFEDVPPTKRRKVDNTKNDSEEDSDSEDEDEEDGMEWDNVVPTEASSRGASTAASAQPGGEIADVSISLKDDGSYIEPLVSAATGRKGPTKRERHTRIQTHCMHVQSLMWHNTIRNSWLNDKGVQRVLVEGLSGGVKNEVQRWREAMGLLSEDELKAKKKEMAAKSKSKKGKNGKDKSNGRDWSYGATEQGVPNLSGGDPLLRLLRVLTTYWRKRFTVTAPGLRKQGYMSLRRMRDEINDWKSNMNDAEEHGERIEGPGDLRKLAKLCEGSRDVGGQLFVALLRGLGLETRMVANLQPVGFGWNKSEEADEKKAKRKSEPQFQQRPAEPVDGKGINMAEPTTSSPNSKRKKDMKDEKPKRKSTRGNQSDPINIDGSESPLSDPPSDVQEGPQKLNESSSDEISVVDLTSKRNPGKKYDLDLAFPNYWTEVCSPVTHKFIPVDPIVLSTIASTDEFAQTFEPRGKKSENAKQVICYTIAFNADGTAKDVTVRYLKRHQLPGKTKGLRMSIEKVPIYNRKGKVKRYEEYDWFRTLMSIYDRPEPKRTAADDQEEQTDLKPFKPAKEEKEVEKESLAWYKQSAEFVLEQHLRREEALIPGAEPVKTFIAGKGDKAKEHPVFRREDVALCRTVESWHKEGRSVKPGEQPIKHVPMRAVTLIRKREIEDAQRETGEKLKQGLYSRKQTEWIIPPPIEDGVIPKNAFGNMDVYVPTMVPRGAVHLPLKGSAKICRKLAIDYAEACTGFEFGKQRAVPVLTGVVVAEEHEDLVRDAWRAEQQEIKRKEDTKRTELALKWWRKMVLGLRVLERMKTEYENQGGGGKEEVNPFVAKARREGREEKFLPDNAPGGGGFLPEGEGDDGAGSDPGRDKVQTNDAGGGGGFFAEGEEPDDVGGGFLVEDGAEDTDKAPARTPAPTLPTSLQSLHKTAGGSADGSDEEDGEDNDGDDKVSAPAKRDSTKSTKARKPARPSKPTSKSAEKPAVRKTVVPDDDEEDDDSPLSDLSDSAVDDDESDGESDIRPASAKRRFAPSPRVVVDRSASSKGHAPSKGKATPVRSQYFNKPGRGKTGRGDGRAREESEEESEVEQDRDEDGEDEDEESEVEVVKPRATTARTRRRG